MQFMLKVNIGLPVYSYASPYFKIDMLNFIFHTCCLFIHGCCPIWVVFKDYEIVFPLTLG